MANWRRYSNEGGVAVFVNLDLAARISIGNDGGTFVMYPGSDGFNSVWVREPPEQVFNDAGQKD